MRRDARGRGLAHAAPPRTCSTSAAARASGSCALSRAPALRHRHRPEPGVRGGRRARQTAGVADRLTLVTSVFEPLLAPDGAFALAICTGASRTRSARTSRRCADCGATCAKAARRSSAPALLAAHAGPRVPRGVRRLGGRDDDDRGDGRARGSERLAHHRATRARSRSGTTTSTATPRACGNGSRRTRRTRMRRSSPAASNRGPARTSAGAATRWAA